MRGAAPAMNMGQPRTQYIHGTGVESDPVAGWVVVVKGPGRGNFCPVYVGMNSVGRESSQRVGLSFGDDSISREEHAFITYDEEQRCFYLQHGGKSNLVRLGGHPVLSPTAWNASDQDCGGHHYGSSSLLMHQTGHTRSRSSSGVRSPILTRTRTAPGRQCGLAQLARLQL